MRQWLACRLLLQEIVVIEAGELVVAVVVVVVVVGVEPLAVARLQQQKQQR